MNPSKSNDYKVRRMLIEVEKYKTILISKIKSSSFTSYAIYLKRRKIK